MISELRFSKFKFKLFVSYTCAGVLLVLAIITTILSQKHVRLDTFSIKVKEYIAKSFNAKITFDASKEIKQITKESKELQRINSTTHTLRVKSTDIFKVKMKTGLMELINPSNPKFAITINESYIRENKNRCSSVSNLTILILVLSAPNNFQRRNTIRETWANGSYYRSYGTIKVVFLLGIINNSEVQGNIKKEFKLYGDIIQGSFIDSYHNLSHKSVMGYKWATERCRNAKYVIKTDDDIVINMFRVLISDIHVMSVNQNHVYCLRHVRGAILRNKRSKWFVESNQFKGMKFYPPYCNGQYVMFLNEIVPYLYDAASKTPLFWIDDVFVYGIVMNNIPALKYKQITTSEFGTYTKSKSIQCWKQEKTKCRYIYHVTRDVKQMKDIWSAIMKQYI